MLININALKGAQPKGYDYEAAQMQLVECVKKCRKVTVEVYLDKQNRAAANITVAGVDPFKVLLDENLTNTLAIYMATGNADLEAFKTPVIPVEEESFALDLCKEFIINKFTVQVRPLFKGHDDKVKVTVPLKQGKLVFLLPREEELMQMISGLNLI